MTAAAVPLLFVFFGSIRSCGIGSGSGGGGRRRTPTPAAVLATAITSAALVAAAGQVGASRTNPLLAGCGAGYAALGYLLLDEHAALSSPGPEPGPGSEAAAAVAAEWIRSGQEVGLCLCLGFLAAAVALENLLSELVVWRGDGWADVVLRNSGGPSAVATRIVATGTLGAARWIAVAVLATGGGSTIGVAFVDLCAQLALALATAAPPLPAVTAVATACSASGMACWWWWWGGGRGAGRPSQPPKPPHAAAILAAACGLLLAAGYLADAQRRLAVPLELVLERRPEPAVSPRNNHPIPTLIAAAQDRYYQMRQNQSRSLGEAVRQYRRRYRMNPPPHFDRWYRFARRRGAVIIDEYDTIHHALKPFWGLPPREIRRRARQAMGYAEDGGQLRNNNLLHAYVRGGEVQTGGQGPEWQKRATAAMLRGFVEWLPDMDLPFNVHDEPRVVVPFAALEQQLARADEQIGRLDLDAAAENSWTPLAATAERAIPHQHANTDWNAAAEHGMWWYSTLSCPPSSPAKQARPGSGNAAAGDRHSGQLLGFVVNATESSDICISPSLENRHGFFDRPNAFNVVQRLYPVFSQSKVSSYGDIVYPSPWYWAHKVPYDARRDPPWEAKKEKLYWRGSTTGGYSQDGRWKRHHRQRIVATIDANDTAKVLQRQQQKGAAGEWAITEVPRETLRELFDVYFSHIGQCAPTDCAAQKAFFQMAPVADQQAAWRWKYLLDVDGNAFSGRYHAFLRSRSVVFKLAIFREWHDEWLHPWVHYVPLTMELDEVAETMRFFRYEADGDRYARRIADESRSWATNVLRDDDLEIWLFRLLLEYARVIDDNRDVIGYKA